VRTRLALALACALGLAGACAPTVDGPVARQDARDRVDGDQLARALARVPGAVRAEVVLHRPVHDPLGTERPGSAAILVVVADHADRAAVTAAATRLVRGAAPEITTPEIVVAVSATRPVRAHVGPFAVAADARPVLVAALAAAFALIAGLAGWLAWRERWRLRGAR